MSEKKSKKCGLFRALAWIIIEVILTLAAKAARKKVKENIEKEKKRETNVIE